MFAVSLSPGAAARAGLVFFAIESAGEARGKSLPLQRARLLVVVFWLIRALFFFRRARPTRIMRFLPLYFLRFAKSLKKA